MIPGSLLERAERLEDYYSAHFPALSGMVKQCFLNTIETTVKKLPDGSYFVITGDIPAMWLRDSSAQVRPYVRYAKNDPELRKILESIIEKQARFVLIDPYANAFNESCNNEGHTDDDTRQNGNVFERKYEVDSLCAPAYLAYRYFKETGSRDIFTPAFHDMMVTVLTVFTNEQRHAGSDYYFRRYNCPKTDTLPNGGLGRPVNYTGMTWSGFRPSDDRCIFGYLIPSNMMAVKALGYMSELLREGYGDTKNAEKCELLAEDIEEGIKLFGIVDHHRFGKIYVYETDGYGNHVLMDDANSPSLLSMPYIGYCTKDDRLYRNTRDYVLSSDNPYYKEGKAAKGVGSPHTPEGYVWHIGIIMQALTSTDRDEIMNCLEMLSKTHAGTNFMHESFDPDDPEKFTRSWFAWANTLFAELLDNLMEENFF
ncbi:MAG: glycoside hydrolase family 125 protein [Lachnospiraceae bacterium]|nr:glycoside hydrolase family 125 protein [Lachnospiraceae bacterium]